MDAVGRIGGSRRYSASRVLISHQSRRHFVPQSFTYLRNIW